MSNTEHSTTPILIPARRKPLYISKIAIAITIKVSTPATATPRQTSPITLSDWNSGCLLRTAFLPRHPNPNGSRGSRGIVPAAEPIIGDRDRLGSKGEEAPGPDEPFRMLRHKKAQHAGPKPRADSRKAADAGSV